MYIHLHTYIHITKTILKDIKISSKGGYVLKENGSNVGRKTDNCTSKGGLANFKVGPPHRVVCFNGIALSPKCRNFGKNYFLAR